MGLDMYAYAQDENGEDEHLADWRKHNRLHGWMEELWEDKGRPNFEESTEDSMGAFNCIPVELTLTDLEQLEAVITNKDMPETGGFFFGEDSFGWTDEDGKPFEEGDYFYKETDEQFIKKACQAIRDGKKVYYNGWW